MSQFKRPTSQAWMIQSERSMRSKKDKLRTRLWWIPIHAKWDSRSPMSSSRCLSTSRSTKSLKSWWSSRTSRIEVRQLSVSKSTPSLKRNLSASRRRTNSYLKPSISWRLTKNGLMKKIPSLFKRTRTFAVKSPILNIKWSKRQSRSMSWRIFLASGASKISGNSGQCAALLTQASRHSKSLSNSIIKFWQKSITN